MSAAERLFDSLRDLLYAWTHRFKARPNGSRSAALPPMPPVPSIDLDELFERHEARLTPSHGTTDGARIERVTMHDHAVSNLFDRRESVRYRY